MDKIMKLKFKIGNIIEFEAEGTTEDVEKQRTAFMETVFPSAVEAIKVETMRQGITPIPANASTVELLPDALEASTSDQVGEDFSRTSLSSFIKKYGDLTDRDFVLFAVYFDEQRNNKKEFNAESIKQYYIEARRTPYSNNSMLIKALIQKGYIMDVASQDDKTGKFYMITDTGLSYIRQYTPKVDTHEKKIKKSHKSSTKAESQYAGLTADDLNIKNYPKVKDQKGAINQLILALYIVTNENKGEWFTFIDIEYLFNQIFEIPFNVSTIKNAINAHKSWFTSATDDKNKKANKYKLLSGAKDEVEKLIQECL